MRDKSKNSFIFLFFLVTIIFMLFLNFELSGSKNNIVVTILENKHCLSEDNTCDIETAEFNLKLSLDKEISYLKPFNISAMTENKTKINKIQLDFNMVGMDMGINRFILKPDDKTTESQKWLGVGIIPICISGRADWVADLDIITNQNHYRMSFPVVIKKNRN